MGTNSSPLAFGESLGALMRRAIAEPNGIALPWQQHGQAVRLRQRFYAARVAERRVLQESGATGILDIEACSITLERKDELSRLILRRADAELGELILTDPISGEILR